MQKYESVIIFPGDLPEDRIETFLQKSKDLITQHQGEVISEDKWGRRRMAYPIQRHREGFYVLLLFKAQPSFLKEWDRFFRVSESILRQMTCMAIPPQTPAADKKAAEPKAEAKAEPQAEPKKEATDAKSPEAAPAQ